MTDFEKQMAFIMELDKIKKLIFVYLLQNTDDAYVRDIYVQEACFACAGDLLVEHAWGCRTRKSRL